jgi:hypothetical protein
MDGDERYFIHEVSNVHLSVVPWPHSELYLH